MTRGSVLTRLNDSFSRRVFLYLAVPMLLLCGVFNVVQLRQERRLLEQMLREEGAALTRLLSAGARVGVFAEDHAALGALLEGVLTDDDVVGAWAYDARGQLLAARGLRPQLDVPPDGPATRELPGHLELWQPVFAAAPYGDSGELYFGAPAESAATTRLGSVGLAVSHAGIVRAERLVLRRNLLLSGAFLLVGALMAYLVVAEATRPLRRLLQRTQQAVGEHPQAGGELAVLEARFDALVQDLGGAFQTIQSLNQGLEQQVAERTAELAAANQQLLGEIDQRVAAEAALQRAHDGLEETVRKRTAQLEHTHAQLLHAEKLAAVGRLTASLAHEFNNPLCGVRNCVEDLRRSLPLGPEEEHVAELALRECQRMAALIRDLNQFSRPSPQLVQPVDVQDALETMVRLCGKDLGHAGVEVVKEYAERLPAVQASEDQLRQVFLNLLQNARDALQEQGGGIVRLRTGQEPGQVEVTVEDDGPGVPAGLETRIFEPFFTTKPAVKGTGLGLAVSFGIVQRFGGSIHVGPSELGGAAFTVRFPTDEGRA